MRLQDELDTLLYLISDQSLTLLPEYHQRIKVSAFIFSVFLTDRTIECGEYHEDVVGTLGRV